MPRLRRFVAAGLNIALPEPHSPESYLALLVAIFQTKKAVRVRGDQHIIISSLNPDTSDVGYIEGSLARFTVIDKDLPWFNIDLLDKAADEDRLSIVIPESLRPNYKPFLFHFDLKHHVLTFEQASGSESISARSVQRFMAESVAQPEIFEQFGIVAVSLIQSEDALDTIFNLNRIRRLRIVYRLPNPDDHSSLEDVMKHRLQAMNSSQVEQIWEEATKAGVTPTDSEIRAFAKSALRNGMVEASGYDSQHRFVTASSEEHPKLASEKFDPQATPERGILRFLAKAFLSVAVDGK